MARGALDAPPRVADHFFAFRFEALFRASFGAPAFGAFTVVFAFAAFFVALFFFATIGSPPLPRTTTMMRAAVRTAWATVTEPLEGRVPFLYLDNAKPPGPYVTIAVGILVDPISMALALPLMHHDGRPATRAEIASAWQRVKARKDLAPRGGMAFANLTDLRLADEDIDRVVFAKLDAVAVQLAAKFPSWNDWCCDAQLFALSHAWAAGANAKYPRMVAALHAGDFETAATECTLNPQIGTIVKRNQMNRILLWNAARVERLQLDPDVLQWPTNLAALEQQDIETLPEIPDPPSDPSLEIEDKGGNCS